MMYQWKKKQEPLLRRQLLRHRQLQRRQRPAPAPAAGGSAGSVQVTAPMPGKILAVKASVGAEVKKGDVILLLEAMKMENEVVAPQDGKIASINVNSGDMVGAGDVLATMD